MELILDKILNILSQIPKAFIFMRDSRSQFWIDIGPLAIGILVQVILVLLIILAIKFFRKHKFSVVFDLFMEEMYKFFEEILGEKTKTWIKTYVISLFFIILIVNLSIWMFDVVRIVFKDVEILEHFVHLPTADFNFTVAMSVVSILIFLFIQFRKLKTLHFLLEYLPIHGKGIIKIDRGDMKGIVYYPIKVIVKLLDIAISLFIGLLDIVGIGAKIISLSARLYGNMVAGGILLTILVVGVNSFTQNLVNVDFPIIAPLILYAQGLLVAIIQAFVFPLLVAIFIKIAQTEE